MIKVLLQEQGSLNNVIDFDNIKCMFIINFTELAVLYPSVELCTYSVL